MSLLGCCKGIVFQALSIVLGLALSASGGENAESPRFLGANSCSSSSCHGGAAAAAHQHGIWSRQDYHSRGYATLFGARSDRIAESLQIPNAASDYDCTVCHAPLQTVPAARLAETAKVEEGVSCESCHGAADEWIRSHTRTDLSHAQKVSLGLRDLSAGYHRANGCVGCHQGISLRLAKAGHPWLEFNLAGQTANMPVHWRNNDDLPAGQAWLIGQLVALRETSWHLRRRTEKSVQLQRHWEAILWMLTGTGISLELGQIQGDSSPERLDRVIALCDALARQFSAQPWSETELAETRSRLVRAASSVQNLNREYQVLTAKKLTSALRDLSVSPRTGQIPNETEQRLRALEQLVRHPSSFDAAAFGTGVRMLD